MIRLKEEHLADIHAQVATIAFYAERRAEGEHMMQRTLFTYTTLHEAWNYCIAQGISRENPGELASYAALTEEYRREYTALVETHGKLLRTGQALQEALTFWLAARYGFDPLHTNYELDLDAGVLREKQPGEQE